MTFPIRAIVRGVSSSFDQALSADPPVPPIDVSLAKRQHAAYVEALRSTGLEVIPLLPDPQFPDGCFVEDCAVVASGVALVTRPGAESRRGEVDSVARALEPFVRKETMISPATLDGGDCLRSGDRIFVGESDRTNHAGITRLEEVFSPLGYEIVPVPLKGVLHLKCLASPLAGDSVLIAENAPFFDSFDGLVDLLPIPAEEFYAANCVTVGKTGVVAANHPATRRILESSGYTVIPVDLSEFRKADGSITCLSILI